MSPEIRRAALRMAAKTALIASLGACSGPAATQPTPITNAVEPKPAPPQSCDQYLASRPGVAQNTFTDVADRTSPRTQQCCHDTIVADRYRSPYLWACCSVLEQTEEVRGVCSPWGPPCPPEMVS